MWRVKAKTTTAANKQISAAAPSFCVSLVHFVSPFARRAGFSLKNLPPQSKRGYPRPGVYGDSRTLAAPSRRLALRFYYTTKRDRPESPDEPSELVTEQAQTRLLALHIPLCQDSANTAEPLQTGWRNRSPSRQSKITFPARTRPASVATNTFCPTGSCRRLDDNVETPDPNQPRCRRAAPTPSHRHPQTSTSTRDRKTTRHTTRKPHGSPRKNTRNHYARSCSESRRAADPNP